MTQQHRRRKSKNPFIDTVTQSIAITDGTYLVTPDGSWDLIVAKDADGSQIIFITGQVSKPSRLDYKTGQRSVVISFAAHTYLTLFYGAPFTDDYCMLSMPDAEHFELAGHVLPLPTYENAERIVAQMAEDGLLATDAVVAGVIRGTPKAASKRSVERHFKTTTGLSPKKIAAIRRAGQAVRRLKSGDNPSVVAADAGYYDQSHLAKELRRLMDATPSDVNDIHQI